MKKAITIIVPALTVLCLLAFGLQSYFSRPDESVAPPMPSVTEIGPGVFTRHVRYHTANQTFVLFKDFVVVFDPGAASDAPGLFEAIRQRTDLPIRYVISSHFHPDHASGASFFEKNGAEIIAGAPGEFDYENWARDLFEKRVLENVANYADVQYPTFTYLEEPLLLDDGQQRMEIRHYGHGHTEGDLVAWLPKQGILLLSDLSNNGPLNLANADLGSWISILDQLLKLPVRIVIPGHGNRGGPELLDINRRFLSQLLTRTGELVKCGKRFDEVLDEIEIPSYEEWAGVAVRDNPENVKKAFLEAGGKMTKKPKIRVLWRKIIGAEPTPC